MPTYNDKLVLDLEARVKGLHNFEKLATEVDKIGDKSKKAAISIKKITDLPRGMADLQAFQNMGTQLGTMKKQGINVNAQLAEMKTRLKGNTAQMAAFNNGIKQGAKSFDMFNLSLMFSGMIMQRAGLSIIRFLVPSMDKLEQLNTEGAKKVMALGAAFEFLKISLFETLANLPLFNQFIEFLINAAIWISEFAQEHPNLAAMVLALGGLATLLGTGFIIAGSWGQISSAIWGIMFGSRGLIDLIGLDGMSGSIGKALKGFKDFIIKGIAGTIGAGLAIYLTWDLFANEDDAKSRINSVLGFAVAGALIGWVFGGPPGAAVGAVIGIFAGITLTITDWIIEDAPTLDDLTKGFVESLTLSAKNMGLGGSLEGVIGNVLYESQKATDNRQLAESKLLTTYEDQVAQIEALLVKQDALANMSFTSTASGVQQLAALEEEKQLLQDQIPNYYLIEDQIRKNQEATTDLGSEIGTVTDAMVQQYASLFAEQLGSEEKTQELIDRTRKFGSAAQEVMGGAGEGVGVIGLFNMFGEAILLDQEYFDTLKSDIDDWAATPTVKTITVQYVHEGTNEDTGGFINRVGKVAGEFVSSITGG